MVFLLVIFILVGLLLFVKSKLSPSGKIKIMINGEKELSVDGGGTLLSVLSNQGIFLPSACGGGGTCIQCTCQVNSGGGGHGTGSGSAGGNGGSGIVVIRAPLNL